MTKLYSIFDQAHLGASLQLSNSNQVVTSTVPSLSVHRMVRCLYAMDVFNGNCEWMVYGSGSITNLAYVGVVDGSAVTTKNVGEDTHGYGLKLSDGNLYSNNVSVAAMVACVANDIIAMVYNATDLSLKFYRGSPTSGFALIGSYTLPTNGPWYPACSIGSTAAGDLSVFFNAGQQAFQYPMPGADGWWTNTAQINPVRLASEDFAAPTTDTVPSQIYDGVIDATNASGISIVRGVSFWPWRQTASAFSSGQSYGAITLYDPNETYLSLLSNDIRDQPITLSRALAQDFGGSVDTAQILATGVVDRVDTAGDFQKTVYIKDALAILDQPVQRSLFLPNVFASAVGLPLPIVAGAARSVPGILIADRTYVFADMAIKQLAVRMSGKILAAGIDYVMTSDARGIVLDVTLYPNGATGKITGDVSTVGGSVVGLTDLLTKAAAYTGTASGTNTYAVTLAPVPGSYVTGAQYTVTFTNANTGAATLNANGLGAKAIQLNGAALTGAEIRAGDVVTLSYNGTSLQMVANQLGGNFSSYRSAVDLSINFGLGGYAGAVPIWNNGSYVDTYPFPRLDMGPEGGAGAGCYAYTKTNLCRAGYSYVAKIAIEHIPAQNLYATIAAYFGAGIVQSFTNSDMLAFVYNPFFVNYGIDGYGSPTIQLTLSNLTATDKPFVLIFTSNNVAGSFHHPGLAKIGAVQALYELPLATSVVNLTGMGLEAYCRLIIETEGGLSAGVWNSADAAAIDTATGYKSIGNYIAHATTIRNALQPVLDSYGADLFIDRSGVIRIIRLVDPGTLSSSGTIDESVIVGQVQATAIESGVTLGAANDSMIAVAPEQATGLTTKFGARKNWTRYADGDFGATSLTDCPNSVRASLKAEFQAIAASGAQLSPTYRYAQQAQALASCFDDPVEAQTEDDRMAALFTQLRFLYAVPVKSDLTDNYEIGQAYQLTYPKYGLSAGKPVLIVGITENPMAEQLTLTCWG